MNNHIRRASVHRDLAQSEPIASVAAAHERFAREHESKLLAYRGWSISQGRWPEPAWMATGPNYDAWTDDGEWRDNGEKAEAATSEALLTEIDNWFEEQVASAGPQSEEGTVVLQTERGPIDVDTSIAPIVDALNKAGVPTIASCSGHGHRPGNIALRDGREIIIARNFEEGRLIDNLFPIGANGEPA